MNKIYKAFDSIKLDENVKKVTVQKIKEFQLAAGYNKRRNIIFNSMGLIFTTVFILFFVTHDPFIEQPVKNKNEDCNVLGTNQLNEDGFLYNHQMYYLVNGKSDISRLVIDRKIGRLHQVDNDLKKNFDSYYHNGAIVYSTDKKQVLIVKSKDETLVYEMAR